MIVCELSFEGLGFDEHSWQSPFMSLVYKKRYLSKNVSTFLRLFSFLLLPCNKEIYFS